MWGTLQNFDRVYKCFRSGEVQMNRSVARRYHSGKSFRSRGVTPAGVVHHIQVRRRSSINRERHVATSLLKPRRFSEQEMNLVSSRRDRKITMNDAAPPAGKKQRIFASFDSVVRNGEGASSRAQMIPIPRRTTPVYVGGGSIAHHNAKNLSGSVTRSSRD